MKLRKIPLPILHHITALNIFDKPQVFSDREKIKEKTSNIDTLWARGKNAFYMVNKAAKDSIYLSHNDIQWESVQGPYKMPEGLTLPYTQNYLSFNYNGAQFNNPDKVVYRYILEGIDKSWSPDYGLRQPARITEIFLLENILLK